LLRANGYEVKSPLPFSFSLCLRASVVSSSFGDERVFEYSDSLMLDLAFVRDHLSLVGEKLRQRGMNPDAILKDFHAIDLERRAAITKPRR